MTTDTESIWRALLDARSLDWIDRSSWCRSTPAGRVTLFGSGTWQADFTLDEEARTLLDSLAPLATAARLVVGQLGQSLDGRIATESGHSHYINGPVALKHLHRLRALVDAVVIGANTACADCPQLTVRRVTGPNPVRVVIDPRARVPARGPLFDADGDPPPVLHVIGPEASPEPAPGHVERLRLATGERGFSPAAVLAALKERGLHRILVEGGAETISRFIHAEALDRLHLLIAPLIIGSGRNGLDLPVIERLDEARRPRMRSFSLDGELLVDVDLRLSQG
ncbi:RibD family protein [Wenzhouxiangella sp. XN24]|uniref:RibD family protein n=1 Tax=Wenzhouxiangella sp. XN24 TaxID=2713569 RepID=UPI0013EDF0D7|nr:RibD family protein [Wenzhouxiangella sp. XN24]NGX17113.1 RibD family protein [Wenzhouxiangella sp. XN24]